MVWNTRRFAAVLLALLMACAPAMAHTMDILLLGVDTYGEAGRSDAMVLARVDAERGEVRLVSFLRDLYVSIPGRGKDRLNAAYFHGGTSLIRRTLRERFGVQPDRVVVVHFPTLAQAIDTLGGVEVEVTQAEREPLNQILRAYNRRTGAPEGDGMLRAAGVQRLTGKQALSLCRVRKIDDDFQRTSRQRRVLEALLAQVRSMDARTLLRVSLLLLGQVETDLAPADLAALLPLWSVQEIALHQATVPFAGTYRDATVNGMMVLEPDLAANRRKLEGFLGE